MSWMFAPIVALVLVALALGWLGLHVLEREVIFVDLSLAQIAALGTTYAVFLGHEPDTAVAYLLGLFFTLIGAVSFALVRHFEHKVPQEALVGVAYVVSAASGAVLMDFAADAHGAEKLQHLMVGNVVWTSWTEIGTMAAVIALVGLFQWSYRHTLLLVSFSPKEAAARGHSLLLWDLLFYLSFGFVITTIVHVVGVLLIFSYLIIPGVIARLFVSDVRRRLLIAWGVSIPISVLGVALSYEHAAGPIVVLLLGVSLLISLVGLALKSAEEPAQLALKMLGGVSLIGSVLWAFSFATVHSQAHAHHEAQLSDEPTAAYPTSGPAQAREAWLRTHADQPDALGPVINVETDDSLRLLLAVLLVKDEDRRGLNLLAALVQSSKPFIRMEADERLRTLAGDDAPDYDPLTAPDEASRWRHWVDDAPDGWVTSVQKITLPL